MRLTPTPHSDAHSEKEQSDTRIEAPGIPNSTDQERILETLTEEAELTYHDTLNPDPAMDSLDTSKGWVFRVFGQYGRVAKYTPTVDTPTVQSATVGKNSKQQQALALIEEHAEIADDGTVDAVPVYEAISEDITTSPKQYVNGLIGQYCYVLVPSSDRASAKSDTGPTDPDDATGQSDTSTLSDGGMIQAFEMGWRLRGNFEAFKRGDNVSMSDLNSPKILHQIADDMS